MLASTAKPSPPTQAFGHATPDGRLEQPTQQVAVAEPAVPVLGKGRMVGHGAVQAQAAKPAIGEVQVDLVAKPPLGADAAAIADQQHADDQLGIHRGTADGAVVGLELPPNLRQLNKAVDHAQQMISGDMVIEAETVEQRLLPNRPLAHHVRALRQED
jgi:hypothetical protein